MQCQYDEIGNSPVVELCGPRTEYTLKIPVVAAPTYDLKWPRDVHAQEKDELLHAFHVHLTTFHTYCLLVYRPGIPRCAQGANDDQVPNSTQTHFSDPKVREIFSPQLVKDKPGDLAVTR